MVPCHPGKPPTPSALFILSSPGSPGARGGLVRGRDARYLYQVSTYRADLTLETFRAVGSP